MTVVAGVILAGGRGARLGGVVKADIRVGGVRLAERTARRFNAVTGPKLLSTGHLPQHLRPSIPTWHHVADPSGPDMGPLAGISAAVSFLNSTSSDADFLMSLAVVTPFFPSDFVEMALNALTDKTDVVIASHAGQIYPTNALWRLAALSQLPENLPQLASTGIKGLIATLHSVELELSMDDGGNPCQNINDISDLIASGKRIQANKS
jgi:molybdopterin-guanine dinucleotide biosynthesis protein A